MPNEDLDLSGTYTYLLDPYIDPTGDPLQNSNLSTSTTATANTITSSSTSTTGTGSAISGTLSTSNGLYINSGYSYNISDYFNEDYMSKLSSPLAKLINQYATEQELDAILDSVKSRVANFTDDTFQNAIVEIISNRHCSEEFILKYLDLTKYTGSKLREILEKHHAVEINTGLYPGLAIYLTLGD